MKELKTVNDFRRWLADDSAVDVATGCLSPDIAAFALETMEINRQTKEGHVEKLSRVMSKGLWGEHNIRSIEFNGRGKMVNGQHRCLAVLKSGYTIPLITVIKNLESHDGLIIDADTRSRSVGDALQIQGVKNANVVGAACTIGCRYDETGSADTLAAVYKRYIPALPEVLAWFKKNPGIEEYSTPAMRLNAKLSNGTFLLFFAYLVHRHLRRKAAWFFEALDGKISVPTDSPVFMLRDRLMSNRALGREDPKKLSHRSCRALIIKAWNLIVREEAVGLLVFRASGERRDKFPEILLEEPK